MIHNSFRNITQHQIAMGHARLLHAWNMKRYWTVAAHITGIKT